MLTENIRESVVFPHYDTEIRILSNGMYLVNTYTLRSHDCHRHYLTERFGSESSRPVVVHDHDCLGVDLQVTKRYDALLVLDYAVDD